MTVEEDEAAALLKDVYDVYATAFSIMLTPPPFYMFDCLIFIVTILLLLVTLAGANGHQGGTDSYVG